jgi:hypothetical protein
MTNTVELATRLFGWVAVTKAIKNNSIDLLENPQKTKIAIKRLRQKLRKSEVAAIKYCHSLEETTQQQIIKLLIKPNLTTEIISNLGLTYYE